ncbi:hypothetical protein ACFQ4X_11995 [Fictibacillus halophilus]|uniref:hypothetical protein n=1 Tax=Fictibacillus halophilus TaxID=1610490 RepID=UPI00362F425E
MRNKNPIDIHINWYGPYTLDQVIGLNNDSQDFGVYQIYGSHPVYGSHILLYVGKAIKQTFGVRIPQHNWHFNKDGGNVQIYIGRLHQGEIKSFTEWEALITLAENMILYACSPARNSQSIKQLPEGYDHIHILNWGQYRDLLPEMSGKRWSDTILGDDFNLGNLDVIHKE